MPVTTYSEVGDLRVGDLRLPARIGNGQVFVDAAAEEIDARLGHIYVTPFEIDSAVAKNRPSILFLKTVNNLIASGRLVLDLAASSEDDSLHAYGRTMLKEGLDLLTRLENRDVLLVGADLIPDSDGELDPTGPMILNEDSESLVKGFYDQPVFAIGAESIFPSPLPRPYH